MRSFRLLAPVLLLGLASPVLAEDSAAAEASRIHVTGRATVETKPDFAAVSVGVTAKAATTAAALDATTAAAGKIIEAAKALGLSDTDIQTGYVSLQPAFRSVTVPGGGSEQRPDGYGASNSVSLRVRDLPRLGEVLRNVVDGGANRIGGIEFGVTDPSALELKAMDAAVRNARRQAEAIAAAAGVKLGRVESIRTGERADRPLAVGRSRMTAMAMPAPPVPVEAGTLEAAASVDIIWVIE